MDLEGIEEVSSNEEAVRLQMNYNHPQEPSPNTSSFTKNDWRQFPGIDRQFQKYIFWPLYGNVSVIDVIIKHQGSTFKHIKSTNLFQYMDELCSWIFERNPRYKGSLEAIGSEAEGIRTNTSDYDFLLVSDTPTIQFEKLEIKLAQMPSVRADVNSETNLRKSYFKVFFKDDVPEEWNDCTDTGSKCLNARLVQRAFAEALTDTIKPQAGSNWNDQPAPFTISNEGNNIVTLSGPAVTIVVNDRANGEAKRMNTDITFAIPLNLTDSTDFWPLDGLFPGVELTDHVRAGQPIKAVHLVPAGDFWRLSFVLEERERMKKLLLDKNKHTCVVALKTMRNSVSLTHDDESPLLSSYPLKWSFMMETRVPEPETWEETTLGKHTLSILDRVVQCGSTGSMTSFFLKEDPVLKDSDRSYLESRRIKKLIEDDKGMCLSILAIYLFVNITFELPLFLDNIPGIHLKNKDFVVQNNSEFASTNSSRCATTECAENTCSALSPLLPGFTIYGFMILLMCIGDAFDKLTLVHQIILSAVTLHSMLVQPLFIYLMYCLESAILQMVLYWVNCIYFSLMLILLIYRIITTIKVKLLSKTKRSEKH